MGGLSVRSYRVSASSSGPMRSPYRYAAAAAAVVTASAHAPIIEDHLHEAPYIGGLFVALVVVCCVEAVVLIRRDTPVAWLCAGLTGVAAIGAYVYSRAVGLPQITDDVGNWTEPLSFVALSAEALLVGLAAAARWRRPWQATRSRWAAGGAVVLVAGLAGTGVAAAHEPSGSDPMAGMSGSAYWNDVGGGTFHSDGRTRRYYVRADVVAWNYAPAGYNEITGRPFDHVADIYVQRGPGRIGSTYLKCLYRGYTDATFRHPLQRPANEQYLGLLGPVIRAEVGDTIDVVFRNTCPFPASMHPHGLLYQKSSEGAPYADGTHGADKADDAVPPGRSHTYVWDVPDRAGPGPDDGSSVMWMYHSHTDEVADTYAGLMGPIEVTRRGMARADGSPRDVDREVFALFSVMNENTSPFLERNVRRYALPPHPDPDDEDFQESNLMHSINGYVFGNMPMISMHRGQRVRWYVMSMGTEVDLHTPHWHGNDVLVGGMRMDVVNLLPASMVVADMKPDNVGTWLFHCHVNDHIRAGMLTRYQVLP
jgi:FtsP/CotA-like multicopper oxidase with cupredoxin domain